MISVKPQIVSFYFFRYMMGFCSLILIWLEYFTLTVGIKLFVLDHKHHVKLQQPSFFVIIISLMLYILLR